MSQPSSNNPPPTTANPTTPSTPQFFRFSPRLTHPSLTLTHNSLTYSGGPTLGLCACSLSSANISHGRNTWTFKVRSNTRAMVLGMVSLEAATRRNFISGGWFCEEGNGLYCVATDGRGFIETQHAMQDTYSNFKLQKDGDQLRVCYDAEKGAIELEKVGEGRVRAKVRELRDGDRYVPCAYVSPDVGSQVEIGGVVIG